MPIVQLPYARRAEFEAQLSTWRSAVGALPSGWRNMKDTYENHRLPPLEVQFLTRWGAGASVLGMSPGSSPDMPQEPTAPLLWSFEKLHVSRREHRPDAEIYPIRVLVSVQLSHKDAS